MPTFLSTGFGEEFILLINGEEHPSDITPSYVVGLLPNKPKGQGGFEFLAADFGQIFKWKPKDPSNPAKKLGEILLKYTDGQVTKVSQHTYRFTVRRGGAAPPEPKKKSGTKVPSVGGRAGGGGSAGGGGASGAPAGKGKTPTETKQRKLIYDFVASLEGESIPVSAFAKRFEAHTGKPLYRYDKKVTEVLKGVKGIQVYQPEGKTHFMVKEVDIDRKHDATAAGGGGAGNGAIRQKMGEDLLPKVEEFLKKQTKNVEVLTLAGQITQKICDLDVKVVEYCLTDPTMLGTTVKMMEALIVKEEEKECQRLKEELAALEANGGCDDESDDKSKHPLFQQVDAQNSD